MIKYFFGVIALTTFCHANSFSQNDFFYLKVESFRSINGALIIKATDANKKYHDTIILVSFKEPLKIDDHIMNKIDRGYGNLIKIDVGTVSVFRLFLPKIETVSEEDSRGKGKFICLSNKDSLWTSKCSEGIYGIANSIGDTVQYINPLLTNTHGAPTITVEKERKEKNQNHVPKTLKEQVDFVLNDKQY